MRMDPKLQPSLKEGLVEYSYHNRSGGVEEACWPVLGFDVFMFVARWNLCARPSCLLTDAPPPPQPPPRWLMWQVGVGNQDVAPSPLPLHRVRVLPASTPHLAKGTSVGAMGVVALRCELALWWV